MANRVGSSIPREISVRGDEPTWHDNHPVISRKVLVDLTMNYTGTIASINGWFFTYAEEHTPGGYWGYVGGLRFDVNTSTDTIKQTVDAWLSTPEYGMQEGTIEKFRTQLHQIIDELAAYRDRNDS